MSDRSGDGEGAGDLRRRRAAGSGGWQRGWPLEEVGRGGTWRGQASREQAVQANQACQALACACHQPALGTSTWAGRQAKTAEKAGRAVGCCGLQRITSQVWSGWRRHGTLEPWKASRQTAPPTAHARTACILEPRTRGHAFIPAQVPGYLSTFLVAIDMHVWSTWAWWLVLFHQNVAGSHLGPATGPRAFNSRHARHRSGNHD